MLRNIAIWSIFLVINFLSVYFLLWFLLLLDNSINGIIIPDFIIEIDNLLIPTRLVILFVETGVWLIVMSFFNYLFLKNLGGYVGAKRFAQYAFGFEYFFVISIVCAVMYGIYQK